jgi:hypothetical protein
LVLAMSAGWSCCCHRSRGGVSTGVGSGDGFGTGVGDRACVGAGVSAWSGGDARGVSKIVKKSLKLGHVSTSTRPSATALPGSLVSGAL